MYTCILFLYFVLVHRYFHVTEGLIPDVMHDILEGILPFEVAEVFDQQQKDNTG